MQISDEVENKGYKSDRNRRWEGDIDLRNKDTLKKSRKQCNYNLLSLRTSNFRNGLYHQLNVLKRNSLLSNRQNIPYISYPIIPNIGVERSKPTALPERRIDSVFRNSEINFQNAVRNKAVDNEDIFVLDI